MLWWGAQGRYVPGGLHTPKGVESFGAYVATQKLPTTVAPQQCVSYSEAASGLLTSYQGTDAGASLPGTPYSVRLQPRCRTQGVRSKGGGLPPP